MNRKRVLRVMQLEKPICVRKKRFILKTTDSNHAYQCYPNSLEKHVPQGLDEVWYADLTYIRVKTDFVYLACVLDGFSRKVVGYAISSFVVQRTQGVTVHCWYSRQFKWRRAMHAVRDESQETCTWLDSSL